MQNILRNNYFCEVLDSRISIDENSFASRIWRYVDLYVHIISWGDVLLPSSWYSKITLKMETANTSENVLSTNLKSVLSQKTGIFKIN